MSWFSKERDKENDFAPVRERNLRCITGSQGDAPQNDKISLKSLAPKKRIYKLSKMSSSSSASSDSNSVSLSCAVGKNFQSRDEGSSDLNVIHKIFSTKLHEEQTSLIAMPLNCPTEKVSTGISHERNLQKSYLGRLKNAERLNTIIENSSIFVEEQKICTPIAQQKREFDTSNEHRVMPSLSDEDVSKFGLSTLVQPTCKSIKANTLSFSENDILYATKNGKYSPSKSTVSDTLSNNAAVELDSPSFYGIDRRFLRPISRKSNACTQTSAGKKPYVQNDFSLVGVRLGTEKAHFDTDKIFNFDILNKDEKDCESKMQLVGMATPEARKDWGSRSEFGDWGSSVHATQLNLKQLRARLHTRPALEAFESQDFVEITGGPCLSTVDTQESNGDVDWEIFIKSLDKNNYLGTLQVQPPDSKNVLNISNPNPLASYFHPDIIHSTAFPNERDQKKMRQSRDKLRRISIGIALRTSNAHTNRTSLSKFPPCKGLEIEHERKLSKEVCPCIEKLPCSQLDAANFKLNVIGGIYKNKFCCGKPVVEFAAGNDQWVFKIEVLSRPRSVKDCVRLKFGNPDASKQKLTFPACEAYGIDTYPSGLLISRSPFNSNSTAVAYFVPQNIAALEENLLDKLQMFSLQRHNMMIIEEEEEGNNECTDCNESHSIDSTMITCSTTTVKDRNYFSKISFDQLQRILSHFVESDLAVLCTVSRFWASTAAHTEASQICSLISTSVSANQHIECVSLVGPEFHVKELQVRFPWGCYLAEGAYKKVYNVWNSTHSRNEAISIMDTKKIFSESGPGDGVLMITQEIRVCVLTSKLIHRSICPNFVETYGFFNAKICPSSSIWCSTNGAPPLTLATGKCSKSPTESAPRYQCIRMELCELGDVEGYIRGLPNGHLPVKESVAVLFQMFFSLYSIRHEYGFRHYDLKLLNFLVKEQCQKKEIDTNEDIVIQLCGLGEYVYEVRMQRKRAVLVKMADFGTGDMSKENLGKPIGIEHFTTIENTPPEMLFWGTRAVQSYEMDTFSLGLAALHIFTGQAPYEELMSEVLCPDLLRYKLAEVWSQLPHYEVIADIVQQDDDSEDLTIFHTFYRYLVLLGIPTDDSISGSLSIYKSPVWQKIKPYITGQKGTKKSKQIAAINRKYSFDCDIFSLKSGTAPCMINARCRMAEVPGAFEAICSMLSFSPTKRPTMYSLLNSDLFLNMRASPNKGPSCAGKKFMTYYRAKKGIYNLPPLIDI